MTLRRVLELYEGKWPGRRIYGEYESVRNPDYSIRVEGHGSSKPLVEFPGHGDVILEHSPEDNMKRNLTPWEALDQKRIRWDSDPIEPVFEALPWKVKNRK